MWKFEGQAPPKGRNVVSWKSPLGLVNVNAYNFFVSGPKFTKFFPPNSGGVVVDNAVFKFLLRRYIPDIFAIIFVESCQKSRWILDVFCPPKFGWGTPSKISVHVIIILYYAKGST